MPSTAEGLPSTTMEQISIPNKSGRSDQVKFTPEEWKAKLTEAQFKVLRNFGTEAAFCGRFYDTRKTGVYHCAGCDLPNFASNAKFDSGTGWPSFFQPVSDDVVWGRDDTSIAGRPRVEILCARCDGHLGHVFDDGPADKTGLRYCINSDALTFHEGEVPSVILH